MRKDRIIENARMPVASSRILLGSGRSGTTWIQDCLAEANDLRPVFEPLHQRQSALGRRCAYDVLTRRSQDDELERYFACPDSGIVPKRWTAYRIPIDLLYPNVSRFFEKNFAKRWLKAWWQYSVARLTNHDVSDRKNLIIKCIRANLMADWLANGLGYPVALIIRHPCAVVESQYRLGQPWDPRPSIERYRRNRKLHAVTDGRYLDLLNGKLSTIEALSLNWVIENQWPYENSRDGGYSVTFYEDLVKSPKESWEKLCASLGLERIPAQDLVSKPSQQSYRKNLATELNSSSPLWQRNLNTDKLNEIQGIMDKTNCRLYSVEDNCPQQNS